MKNLMVLSVLLLLIIHACSNDDSGLEGPMNSKFIGIYEIENEHISGIHTEFDSSGNITFQGYDTTLIVNDQFIIENGGTEDSVIINSLINGFYGGEREVKGVFMNDSIQIVHEFSDQLNKDYIRGRIWFEGDSLRLDYRWDQSNIWANYAPPMRGMVLGVGVRR